MSDPAQHPAPSPVPQPPPAPPPTQEATSEVVPQAAPAPAPAPQPAKAAHTPEPAAKPQNTDADTSIVSDEQDNARLLASIDDAYALLDFAARRGLNPDSTIAAPIIRCHDKVTMGKPLTPEEETVFWQTFSKIIEMVQPVTVESILFTTERTKREHPHSIFHKLSFSSSPADRVLKRYLAVSILSLMVLLTLQVQWAIGMSIYNDAFQIQGFAQAVTKQTSQTSIEEAQLGASLPDTTTAEPDQSIDSIWTPWKNVSYVRLWWWNRQMASYIPPFGTSTNYHGPPSEAGVVKLADEGRRHIEFTRAQLTLEIISNYVLVTLFALLGSMTQALRKLSQEIASVSLTTNSMYRIRTRIILGVISGVCMAWLMIFSSTQVSAAHPTPLESLSFIGAFTPWAVAFTSGYSVEIFFTALERAIAMITARIQEITPQSAAQPHVSNSQPSQPSQTSPPPQKTTPPAPKAPDPS